LAADFHLLSNLALAASSCGRSTRLAWLCARFLPEPPKAPIRRGRSISTRARSTRPTSRLACAARETLHVGDLVESMPAATMTALLTDDRKAGGADRRHGRCGRPA